MAEQWYYAEGTKHVGPLSADELKRKLRASSKPWGLLVWRPGLSEWRPAGFFPELAPQQTPPPIPERRKRRSAGIGAGLFVVLILVLGWALSQSQISPPTSAQSQASPSTPATPASTPAIKTCRDDWTKCVDNEDMAHNYSKMDEARLACEIKLEHSVRYGTPEYWYVRFNSFFIGGDFPKTGIVKIVDDRVKIQNVFGAKVNSRVECWYDFNKKVATIVSVSER
jgi:hypothetical protein